MEDPQPDPSGGEESRSSRIMARLKDSILSQLEKNDPSFTVQTHHSSFIQCRLQQLLGSFDTPTHPPYALMVHRAIMELNDGRGSTEKAISNFIHKEYKDLPWAHVKILRVHLGMLCQEGELACAEDGKYRLVVDDHDASGVMDEGEEAEQFKGIKRTKRGETRSDHKEGERKGTFECCEGDEIEIDNAVQEEGIEEHVQVSQLDATGTDETSRVVERTQDLGEQPHNQSIGMVEESEKGCFAVVGKQGQYVEAEAPVQNELRERKRTLECCEGVEIEIENGLQEEGTNQHIQVSQLDGASNEETSRVIECTLEQADKPNNRSIGRIQESEKGCFEVAGKQSQHAEAGTPSRNKLEESQIQDSILQLEASCTSDQTALNTPVDSLQPQSVPISEGLPKFILTAGVGLSLAQLQLQMPRDGPFESIFDAAAKIPTSSSSLNAHEHRQDKNPVDRCCLSQPQGLGRGRGRSRKNARHITDQIQAQGLVNSCSNQQETINSSQQKALEFPLTQNFEQKSMVPTSEGFQDPIIPTGIKLPPTQLQDINASTVSKMGAAFTCVNVHDKLPQHCNQGIPESQDINTSTVSKMGATFTCVNVHDKQPQHSNKRISKSPDINTSTVSKMGATFTCVNVHDKQPQHWNKGVPKRKLEESTFAGVTEPKPTKRPRGRPRKLTVTSLPGESLLPLDDSIHNKLEPNINKMEKQCQYNQGRGRGRPRKLKCEEQFQLEDQPQQNGRGRGPGRPPKLNQNDQHVEPSLQEDQAKQSGGDRGRGRPRILDQNANQCEEQLQQEDEAQQEHVQSRDWGRPRKLNQSTNKPEMHLQQEDRAQQSRGRGRPRKLNQNTNKPEMHLQQDQALQQHTQSRGWGRPHKLNELEGQSLQQHVQSRGQGRPRKLNQNTNKPEMHLQQEDQAQQQQCEEQLQQEDRAQQQHVGGRDLGRPLKLNQSTNKTEVHLDEEDETLQQHLQRRGQRRPPKQNQDTNHCEGHLQPQDQAPGLVSSPNSGCNNSQSLEQNQLQLAPKKNQLHLQSFGRHHKLKSREAVPSARLRLRSESRRCGSGEAS